MKRYGEANQEWYHDRHGYPLTVGAIVKFNPAGRNTTMTGKVTAPNCLGEMVSIHIDGDPFPSYVSTRKLELVNPPAERKKMATSQKTSVRELRQRAKVAGVADWGSMDRDQLEAAVAEAESGGRTTKGSRRRSNGAEAKATATTKTRASKAAPTPAPAKDKTKTKAVKASPSEVGDNPFREGSALFAMTEELLKGGKRSEMVKRLSKVVELKPRSAKDDYDEEKELDYRLVRLCQLLNNNYGFTIEKEGRGPEQTVKAIPPV